MDELHLWMESVLHNCRNEALFNSRLNWLILTRNSFALHFQSGTDGIPQSAITRLKRIAKSLDGMARVYRDARTDRASRRVKWLIAATARERDNADGRYVYSAMPAALAQLGARKLFPPVDNASRIPNWRPRRDCMDYPLQRNDASRVARVIPVPNWFHIHGLYTWMSFWVSNYEKKKKKKTSASSWHGTWISFNPALPIYELPFARAIFKLAFH